MSDIFFFFYRIPVADSIWRASEREDTIKLIDGGDIEVRSFGDKRFEDLRMRTSLHRVENICFWIEAFEFPIVISDTMSEKKEGWLRIIFFCCFQ